jgi:Histone deacetylase complex, SIN3 component
LGVPPKSPEEFKILSNLPNVFSYDLFKCEDERYYLDLNINKYQYMIKSLNDAYNNPDPDKRIEAFQKIIQSNVSGLRLR